VALDAAVDDVVAQVGDARYGDRRLDAVVD
jgi:hypothetical protein